MSPSPLSFTSLGDAHASNSNPCTSVSSSNGPEAVLSAGAQVRNCGDAGGTERGQTLKTQSCAQLPVTPNKNQNGNLNTSLGNTWQLTFQSWHKAQCCVSETSFLLGSDPSPRARRKPAQGAAVLLPLLRNNMALYT